MLRWSKDVWHVRDPGTRFSGEQIEKLTAMAAAGASGKEIAAALGLPAQAIRAKCASLGIALRRPKSPGRTKMMVTITEYLCAAARRRNISATELIHRLLRVISQDRKVDMILADSPLVTDEPSRLAAVHPEESAHSLVDERLPRSLGAAAFPWQEAEQLRTALSPQLIGYA